MFFKHSALLRWYGISLGSYTNEVNWSDCTQDMYFERSMTCTTPWNTSVVHHFFLVYRCVWKMSGESSCLLFEYPLVWRAAVGGLAQWGWGAMQQDLLFRKDVWESTDSSDPHPGTWLERGLDFRVVEGFEWSIERILINPTSTKGCDVFWTLLTWCQLAL